MSLESVEIDFDDISRFQKQDVRADIAYEAHVDTENPLHGVTRKQRARTEHVADVMNIGAGTRCKYCGFLHFMWRATCGACEKPMEYNLETRDEENRI
jgi:hypothetical protein